ncbi:MAG: hypothetical protein KA313_09520 [Pseudarcicella sp.]|nr:hypothetical protein [Pseudarcicella sp.]MBP6411326.1 hypothetical protein [Pseudarcicella sp.]
MNKLLTIFALTFTTLLFTNCGKTDEIISTSTKIMSGLDSLNIGVKETITKESIIKNWKEDIVEKSFFSKVTKTTQKKTTTSKDGYIEFKSDSVSGILYNDFSEFNNHLKIKGTYSLNKNVLKINSGTKVLYFNCAIVDSKLTLKSNKELIFQGMSESNEITSTIEQLYGDMNIILNYR